MADMKIPRATAKRLPIYYQYLNILADAGQKRISSSEFAAGVKVDPRTIRRGFSHFGTLGKRGYGYDVADLLAFFKKILKQDQVTKVALVGVGNLGHALLNFNFHRDNNIAIRAAFDIDPAVVGTTIDDIRVYPLTELQNQLQEQAIKVVILTVPEAAAQTVTDQLIAAGVEGIMNFTPTRINVPATVIVQNVNLTSELQTLIYFLNHRSLDQQGTNKE